jgi:magnesium transporter
MRIVVYEGQTVTDAKTLDWERWFGSDQYIVWIDMTGPNVEDTRIMREVFRFHPLAIEQVLDHKQRPKVEEYNDHLFTIMNSAHVDNHDVYFRELDIFVKHNVVVTVHRFPEPAIDTTRRRVNETCELFPVLDQLEQQLDHLEDEVINKPTQDKLSRLFQLKRTVAEIWRISAQQRDMFSVLMRDESPYVNQTTLRYYLRDVYDHLLRIYDNASAIRDNVSNAVDLFFSAQSQQLNQYVNRLTLITISTGILAVVTGFYGMNFERTWPDFSEPWGVPFVVLLIALVLIGLFLILRRQRQE